MKDTWCEALFASGLQPSDAPTAGTVAIAISCATHQFGAGGCAGRMAQEWGDHPDVAVKRMRWVRQLVAELDKAFARVEREALDLAVGE